MKRIIKSFFRLLGLELRRAGTGNRVQLEDDAWGASMMHGLARMSALGIRPASVIDLGAAQGNWTRQAMRFWPDAQYLLFEPLQERENELETFRKTHPNAHLVLSAAGKQKGKVEFTVSDDLDGSGVYPDQAGTKKRTVDVATIDDEVHRLGLKPPFLLKFDTHGFEVPILEGARQTLKHTDLVVMECYGFRLSPGSLLAYEMCAHLEQYGFRLCDIVDVMRRPGDKLLWQCDLFFLPVSHPSFKRSTYL